MGNSEIWDILQKIDREDVLREQVLMRLFSEMHLDPDHTHGPGERGKDIVFTEQNRFGFQEWVAVVVKVGKIHAKASGSGSIETIINQVESAFRYPYKESKTKKELPISKVLVITNGEIIQTAKENIVDGLGKPDAVNANIHFVDGNDLAGVIAEHWPDFKTVSQDLLNSMDVVNEHAALVLYVLSRPHSRTVQAKREGARKDMSTTEIARQAGITKPEVERTLPFLSALEYVEKTSKGTLRLHSKKTVGRILTDEDQIQLLFEIEKMSESGGYRFKKNQLDDLATQRGFTQSFVRDTFGVLKKGEYVNKDKSRGGDCYKLDMKTLDEEREYLKAHLEYHGRIPSKVK